MFKEYFKAVSGWDRFWFLFLWGVVALNLFNCVMSITEDKYNEAFLYALVALLFVIVESYTVLLWKSYRDLESLLEVIKEAGVGLLVLKKND